MIVDRARDDTPERDHPLAAIVAFLGGEIDYSSSMLQNLATSLSEVIIALSNPGEKSGSHPTLACATQALQNEDRIQQRLSDVRRTLLILEHVLRDGACPATVDLDHAIIEQLQLDEMRDAFAATVGMPGREVKKIDKVPVPCAGDVDLF